MQYKSLQKIKGKNILQGVEKQTNMTEIYSENMEKVLEMNEPNIQIQDEYIIVSNEDKKVYIDKTGNIIEDTSNLGKTIFPDKIGEYTKNQVSLENIYYSK